MAGGPPAVILLGAGAWRPPPVTRPGGYHRRRHDAGCEIRRWIRPRTGTWRPPLVIPDRSPLPRAAREGGARRGCAAGGGTHPGRRNLRPGASAQRKPPDCLAAMDLEDPASTPHAATRCEHSVRGVPRRRNGRYGATGVGWTGLHARERRVGRRASSSPSRKVAPSRQV